MDDARLVKAALIVVCTIVCFWCSETASSTRRNCPKYDLKNGNVIYRNGNRLVKHYCNRGYIIVGSRHSTCVRGRWNKPLPICASTTGCNPLQPPPQGFLQPNYNQAIIYYRCNPGYSLIGLSPVYCDGKNWNGTTPACIPAIQTPKLFCDFEQPSLCNWSQDTKDDMNWRWNQFSTPYGHGTGPSYDHTLGIGASGYYLYLELKPYRRSDNQTARLYSPVFYPDYRYSCFTFWYHMFGTTIGSLRVYIKADNQSLANIQPSWQKDGEQEPKWMKGSIPIPTLHRNFQIIIEGVRIKGLYGDIAIDDVKLQFESCQDETTVKTDFTSTTRTTALQSAVTKSRASSITTLLANSTTSSIATQPITFQTTKPIDVVTTTQVSVTVAPVSTQSVTDVTTPSQLESIVKQTSSTASTNAEWLQGNETKSPGATTHWRTKQPKSAKVQSSKTLSKGVLAGVIIVGILVLLTGVAVLIYFMRYRFKKDALSEDSDMRYLAGSEQIEYIDNYHSSSYLEELTAT